MILSVGTHIKYSEPDLAAVKEAIEKLGQSGQILFQNTTPEAPVQYLDHKDLIAGARAGAQTALTQQKAEMAVGIETGVVHVEEAGGWFRTLCVVALTSEGKESIGFSASIPVPDWMIKEVQENKADLNAITEKLAANGDREAFEYFSNGVLTRQSLLTPAIIATLSKIVFHDKYHL